MIANGVRRQDVVPVALDAVRHTVRYSFGIDVKHVEYVGGGSSGAASLVPLLALLDGALAYLHLPVRPARTFDGFATDVPGCEAAGRRLKYLHALQDTVLRQHAGTSLGQLMDCLRRGGDQIYCDCTHLASSPQDHTSVSAFHEAAYHLGSNVDFLVAFVLDGDDPGQLGHDAYIRFEGLMCIFVPIGSLTPRRAKVCADESHPRFHMFRPLPAYCAGTAAAAATNST